MSAFMKILCEMPQICAQNIKIRINKENIYKLVRHKFQMVLSLSKTSVEFCWKPAPLADSYRRWSFKLAFIWYVFYIC